MIFRLKRRKENHQHVLTASAIPATITRLNSEVLTRKNLVGKIFMVKSFWTGKVSRF